MTGLWALAAAFALAWPALQLRSILRTNNTRYMTMAIEIPVGKRSLLHLKEFKGDGTPVEFSGTTAWSAEPPICTFSQVAPDSAYAVALAAGNGRLIARTTVGTSVLEASLEVSVADNTPTTMTMEADPPVPV